MDMWITKRRGGGLSTHEPLVSLACVFCLLLSYLIRASSHSRLSRSPLLFVGALSAFFSLVFFQQTPSYQPPSLFLDRIHPIRTPLCFSTPLLLCISPVSRVFPFQPHLPSSLAFPAVTLFHVHDSLKFPIQ